MVVERFAAVTLVCGACAATTSTCPTGTKLIVAQRPEGRAELCAATDAAASSIPAVGRSFDGRLGEQRPPALTGGVDGPFTSWYPNGTLAARGRYASLGARSFPEGLWAFWRPDGQRWVAGKYVHGVAVGCFAEWDEQGHVTTGTVQGDELHASSCTPPPEDDLLTLEGHAPAHREPRVWGDVSFDGFLGPNRLGATNDTQARPDDMSVAFQVTARKRLGRLRIGPTAGMRLADKIDSLGYVFGASVGWELPKFHPRIDSEVSADLAIERLSVAATRMGTDQDASLAFWAPLPAVQLGFAFTLSPAVAAVAAVRVEGTPATDVERDVTYCDSFGCSPTMPETWQVGSIAYGVNVGLRLLIR